MLLDDASLVKKGMNVFYVHCFPCLSRDSYILGYVLTDDPKPSQSQYLSANNLFVDAVPFFFDVGCCQTRFDQGGGVWDDVQSSSTTPSSFSLTDAGIDQPTPPYNDHKLFDDLDEAKLYVEHTLGLTGITTFGSMNSTSPGTDVPDINFHPDSTIDDDWDRAMRGI